MSSADKIYELVKAMPTFEMRFGSTWKLPKNFIKYFNVEIL